MDNREPGPSRLAHHADEFVTLCAWTRTVKFEGEWMSVEAYLPRR